MSSCIIGCKIFFYLLYERLYYKILVFTKVFVMLVKSNNNLERIKDMSK